MQKIDHRTALRQFRLYLQNERDFVHTTAQRYQQNISKWLVHLGKRRMHMTEITKEDCVLWWGKIKRQYSSATAAQILSSLRHFYDWLFDNGYYEGRNWWRQIQRPDVVHAERPVISEEDMWQLYRADVPETIRNIRNRAIVLFLWGTALRNSEACKVLVEHVDLAHRVVFVQWGKKRKTAKQPIPEPACEAIKDWLYAARHLFASTKHRNLFLTLRGKPMTPDAMCRAVKSFAQVCGRPDLPIAPHVLRKTAITQVYLASGDIYVAQKVARHSKPETTQIYVAVPDRRVVEAVERFHPLAHPPEERGWLSGRENARSRANRGIRTAL